MDNIINFKKKMQMNIGGLYKMREIKKERMLEIEGTVSEILQGVDFSESPYVDIVHLVKKDGFTVNPTHMPIDTTGCIFVDEKLGKNGRTILVNTRFKNPDNESDVVFKKSRFITAHEYGHYKLHKKAGEPMYAHRDTYHRTDKIELEADYFARSILMPLDQFKAYQEVANDIGKNDEEFTVLTLSRIFNVTRNKTKKRMEDILVLN